MHFRRRDAYEDYTFCSVFLNKFEFENILMDTPKTSDDRNTILYILAFIMSAVGIVIISVAEHKRRKNNKQK